MTPERRFAEARSLLLSGRPEAAEKLLTEQEDITRADADLSLLLAFAFLEQRREASARDWFACAATLPIAQVMLARLASEANDAVTAAFHLCAAVALDPQSTEGRHNLGVTLAQSGLLVAAERILRRLGTPGHEALAQVLFDRGCIEDAIALASPVLAASFRAELAAEVETPPGIAMSELGIIVARLEPDIDLIRIEGAAIHSGQWHVAKDGKFSSDLVFVWPQGEKNLIENGRLRDTPRGRSFEAAILWGGSDNFYHWMADDLPRLPGILAAPGDLPILFHGTPTSFQRESLAHLGLPETRLMPLDGVTRHEIGTLYAPVARKPAISWLRERFADWQTGGPPRLFISRRTARFRRLVNESEIEALLIDEGFTVIEPEYLSLREQIACFSAAEIVIGVHGAGLTNMIFAPPDATLIELHPPGPLPPYFKAIAGHLGQTHHALSGLAVQALPPLKREFWHFTLDPAHLRLAIKHRA